MNDEVYYVSEEDVLSDIDPEKYIDRLVSRLDRPIWDDEVLEEVGDE